MVMSQKEGSQRLSFEEQIKYSRGFHENTFVKCNMRLLEKLLCAIKNILKRIKSSNKWVRYEFLKRVLLIIVTHYVRTKYHFI